MVLCRFLDLGAVGVPEEVIFRNSSARRIAVPVGAVLLEAGTRCILFDTGFGDGDAVVDRWMESKAQRELLLGDYTTAGAGVYRVDGITYVTCLLAK